MEWLVYSALLEKLVRSKVDERLFNSGRNTVATASLNKATKWNHAIRQLDQQQGVGKYLIPYPLNPFNNPWSPTETLMSKNLNEVENQLVYVLKKIIF